MTDDTPSGMLVVPPDIMEVVNSLPESSRARLSLYDVDVLTRPFRDRIAALAATVARLEQELAEQKNRADDAEAKLARAVGALDSINARCESPKQYHKDWHRIIGGIAHRTLEDLK